MKTEKDFDVLWKVAMNEIEAFSGASRDAVRSGLTRLYKDALKVKKKKRERKA